jgi:LacI family transcriptional regulator
LRAASEFGGLEVVVFDHESAALASSPALASMPIHGRLDGLLVMGLPIEEGIAKRFYERGLPTVAVDADSDRFSRVVIDDVDGGRLAARHLLAKGHRRLGYILERQVSDYESQAVRRLVGFKEVAADDGCDIAVEISDNSVEHARLAATRLLQRDPRPTATMAHHDLLAIGALLAVRDLGLSVPADVAVMGFDDGDMAVAADLTTVRQPFEESGEAAVRLLRSLDARSPRSTIVLGLDIIERSTV